MTSAASETFVYEVAPFRFGIAVLNHWRHLVENVLIFAVINYIFYFWLFVGVLYLLYLNGFGYVALVLTLAYLPSFFDDAHNNGGRVWHAFRTHSFWLIMSHYLGLKMIREDELDSKKKYIFGYHPHGILILSRITTYGGNWEALFPNIETRVLAASPMFYVPLTREICLWTGAVDASRKSARKVLKNGQSLIVYPGGSKEIFNTNPNSKENLLVLKSRKGFIRLAIQEGAELVPTFVFGEKFLYSMWSPPASVWQSFLKYTKLPLLLFWGRFMTLVPKRKKIGVVYGKPIQVDRTETPSPEYISEVQDKYIAAVNGLFHKYKDDFGYDKDEVLVIE